MGNSVLGGRTSAVTGDGVITKFYTSAAWIDGRAEAQLKDVASWTGVQKIAAFPDLHPGKFGPVGCAVLADRIFPQLIGNDIGCGMSLFQLDLPVRKLKLEKALRRMRVLGEPATKDQRGRLEEIGLPPDLFATSLGTIGGGNHFCEVQSLSDIKDGTELDTSRLCLLVHSGSRGFGNAILEALPDGAFAGLNAESDTALVYSQDHDRAVRWASLNRRIIAERAAEALRTGLTLLVDAPHNLLAPMNGNWLHRKGAAVAEQGIVPLAGSRASASYLMSAMGHVDALGSLAHGAGRRYDRSSMHGRVRAKKPDIEAMQRTPFGGRILCEDRDLLIEEAPMAYKSAKSVAEDLQRTGAAECVAEFHPLLTFKKNAGKGAVMTATQHVSLLVTSGGGPAECQQAVAGVLEMMRREAEVFAVDFDTSGARTKHGFKSAVVLVSGTGAEAFAKTWRGTIQWRAQSTLRPTHKRANWFIGVFDLGEPVETPDRIDARDVTFDTFRAGGPGGQHQNTTDSAVRATHRPTGLSAVAREERSQHRNKALALERLQRLMAAQSAADEAAQKANRNELHHALERGNPVRCFKGHGFRDVKGR